ncbi:Uncharacterised protein [Legionella londiniensis]|nr:Uncharacterised protein [Legionella londiniensis]
MDFIAAKIFCNECDNNCEDIPCLIKIKIKIPEMVMNRVMK